jgi:hypothetical protein
VAYQIGTTVRLSVTFRNFAAAPTAPDAGTARLSVYKETLDNLLFTISQASLTPGTTGVFTFDWVSTDVGNFLVEWFGMISGDPSVIRRTVTIVEV